MDNVVLARSRWTAAASRGTLHFAPKAKRVIYLFMAGAPSQLDLFDPKPKLTSTTGRTSPRSSSRASASRSSRARRSCWARRSSSQKHGQSGAELSELLPHLVEGRRRHRHRPVDADDAVQPRAGADLHEHRPPGDRPAEPRLVAQLRARQREQRPARLRRPALGREQSRRRQVLLGQRLSADRAPGRRVPIGRRPGAVRLEPGRRRRRTCGARSIAAINDLNRLHAPRRRRSRRSRRASPPTSWRIACRPACPS